MRNRFIHTLLCCMLLFTQACYTGTETTPRIDDADVGRIVKSEEERIMEEYFVHEGCHAWQIGKAFAYVDDQLSPVLRPEEDATLSATGLRGKIFTYEGYREVNLYGNKPLVTLIFRCENDTYSYQTGKSMQEIADMEYTPLIPSFVDMDNVATARALFTGKQVYILTNQWYDANGYRTTGRKLVPVTITDVLPGNNVLPLAVLFTDERDNQGRVYMSTQSSTYTQILTFDRLFSFTNPRNRHKEITDEMWEAITAARIVQGMTKEECKLAIGLPTEVKKIPTYSGLKEQWIYNTGAYLLFSDGILDAFRQ